MVQGDDDATMTQDDTATTSDGETDDDEATMSQDDDYTIMLQADDGF